MPPPQRLPQIIREVSAHKGMVNKDFPWLLGESTFVHAENLIIDRLGARKHRGGVSSIGGRNDAPGGIFMLHDDDKAQDSIFAINGGQLYIMPGAGVVEERASAVSLTNNLHMFSRGRYKGRVAYYITQAGADDSSPSLASNLMVVTDNNTYTQQTSLAPTVSLWWQNRLWCNNVIDQDLDTLWWSELGDGLSFSLTNTTRIEPGVGGNITGFVPLRGNSPQLLIFKERAIAVLTTFWGSSSSLIPIAADALDFIKSSIRLVSDTVGCVSPQSIQFIPGAPGGDIYFLARDGVRAVSRAADDTVSGASRPISDAIIDTINRINFKFAKKAVSAFFDNKYHLAVPLDGATENTHILSFDVITGAWYLNTWKAKSLVVGPLNETQDRLWMQYNTLTSDSAVTGTSTDYHVFKTFTGTIDPGSSPIITREDSRAYAFGDMTRRKTWDHFTLHVRNEGNATALYTILYNVDQKGWITAATNVAFAGKEVPILAQTPLPWLASEALVRQFRLDLTKIEPGYFIQMRVLGQSHASQPIVVETDVSARILDEEFDNRQN